MSKVAYHCCACRWDGKRVLGSTKPCPHCKKRVEAGYSFDCPRCNPPAALRAGVTSPAERPPSAWPGGVVPAVMRVLTLDTAKVTTYAIPRQPKRGR